MNIGLIFAGGIGSRMCSKDRPKQFLEIYNKPIIVRTIEYFQRNSGIDVIVVVCHADWIEYLDKLIFQYSLTKIKAVVPGGETGQLSIYNGLKAAKSIAGNEDSVVLIHDGVRPLINSDLLSKNIDAVKTFGSCITSGIVKETIVTIDDNGDITFVPDRVHSRVAKAPQSFWLDQILESHEKALALGKKDFIDSCTMMQYFGYRLHMIDGPYENIKITTPDDFYTMRAILQVKEDQQIYGIGEE